MHEGMAYVCALVSDVVLYQRLHSPCHLLRHGSPAQVVEMNVAGPCAWSHTSACAMSCHVHR